MIEREELIELYNNQLLTDTSIADKFGVDWHKISALRKKYDIASIKGKRNTLIVRNKPITQDLKSLTVGSLLGDGCITVKDNSYFLMFGHSEKQYGYLEWKRLLGKDVFMWKIKNIIRTGGYPTDSLFFRADSIPMDYFKYMRNVFYTEGGVKFIPANIKEMLDPLSVAIWFMDDGHCGKNDYGELATSGFTYEEQYILKNALYEKFNIKAKVGYSERRNTEKVYYRLQFRKAEMLILFDIIGSIVNFIPCMRYKIPRASTTLCKISCNLIT